MKTTADIIAIAATFRDGTDQLQSEILSTLTEEESETLSDAYQAFETFLSLFEKRQNESIEDSYPSYEDQHRLTARELGVVA